MCSVTTGMKGSPLILKLYILFGNKLIFLKQQYQDTFRGEELMNAQIILERFMNPLSHENDF